MSRLYLRFYLALFASLVAFALIAVGVWHSADGPMEQASATLSRLAANILPPADAPIAEQQAALERLTTGLDGDVTLLDPQRQRIAFVGHPLQLQQEHINHLSWSNPYRRGVVWLVHLPDGRWLLTSVSLTRAAPMHKALMLLLGLAFAISVGAYPLVRWLTKRLERLQVGVESLGAGDLKARVAVEGRDEVARLATSFNRAAERIEALVGAHKSLLANASHELRTPLARIRLAIELSRDSIDPRRAQGIEQDIAELNALIDEILLASRLDALNDQICKETIELLPLIAEECARFDHVQFDGIPLSTQGDARLLKRLLTNLLENARKYGVPPTQVTLAAEAGRAVLTVSDAGLGIPAAEYEKVFEPFYRRAGGSENIGAGLGLALVRQIAQRHGGEARCVPLADGRTGIAVSLPAFPAE